MRRLCYFWGVFWTHLGIGEEVSFRDLSIFVLKQKQMWQNVFPAPKQNLKSCHLTSLCKADLNIKIWVLICLAGTSFTKVNKDIFGPFIGQNGKTILAVQHSQYPTSIPFFWQIWRYSFIEIFPSLNGSAESKIAVKAKKVLMLKGYIWERKEYMHYLFCLYPRGFFSPSVSARPQTPFWLTADSTMMREKVEPLNPLKLSKRILSEPKTRAHCLNLPKHIIAFVFQTRKVLSGTIKKYLSNTTGKRPAHTEYR